MQAILSKLVDSMCGNPHTSWSAVVLFIAAVVGIIWPTVKPQADEIAKLAIVYGLIRAGDASQSQQVTKP